MSDLTAWPSPFWGSQFIPSAKGFFLEIFAGEAGLTQAIHARGRKFLPPIEILPNNFVLDAVDILDQQVVLHIKKLIAAGSLFFIHFGTPCSSFSLARKDDGGPPPLRDRANLWGRPNLRACDIEKVQLGNQFMAITAELVTMCHRCSVGWSVENPAGSFLWSMPLFEAIETLPQVERYLLDMCRFGSPHKKPTAILSNRDLRTLALLCDRPVRPHDHEPLVGMIVVEGKKVFKTKLAQVYPHELCSTWAQAICADQQEVLARTFAWSQPSDERKRPVGQAIPWSGHKQQVTAQKALAAGYQLKRSALPPLLQIELEPGEAVRRALQLQHPFTVDPALEPDLQEALALAVLHVIAEVLFNFGTSEPNACSLPPKLF